MEGNADSMKRIIFTLLLSVQLFAQEDFNDLRKEPVRDLMGVTSTGLSLDTARVVSWGNAFLSTWDAINTISYQTSPDTPLDSLIAEIDTAHAKIIIGHNKSFAASARDTIPENIYIDARKGGIITVTKLLTVEGGFSPSRYQTIGGNIDSIRFEKGSIEYVTPEMFGGTHARHIQAAVNSLNFDGNVVFGPGVYTFDNSVTIPKGINLIGTIVPNSDPTIPPDGTTFYRVSDNKMLVSVGSHRTTGRTGSNHIKGIHFLDSTNVGTESWVYTKYSDSILLENCLFSGLEDNTTTGIVIEATESWDWRINNCIFKNAGYTGYPIIKINNGADDSSNDWQFFQTRFQEPRGKSILFNSDDGGSRNSRFWFTQCKWEGLHATPTGSNFIDGEASDVFIFQSQFAWCADTAISIVEGSTRWRITDNMFFNNEAYDIYIDSLANRVTIRGNEFSGGSFKNVSHHINLNGTKTGILHNIEYTDTTLYSTTKVLGQYDQSNRIWNNMSYGEVQDSIFWEWRFKNGAVKRSNGYLGIGTVTPTYNIDVINDNAPKIVVRNNTANTSSAGLYLTEDGGSGFGHSFDGTTNTYSFKSGTSIASYTDVFTVNRDTQIPVFKHGTEISEGSGTVTFRLQVINNDSLCVVEFLSGTAVDTLKIK